MRRGKHEKAARTHPELGKVWAATLPRNETAYPPGDLSAHPWVAPFGWHPSYVIRRRFGKRFLHRNRILCLALAADVTLQQCRIEWLAIEKFVVFQSDEALLHAYRSRPAKTAFNLR